MTKYGTPPIFSPENFFTKATQNGLKWTLNTTFENVTFCRRDPPPLFSPEIFFTKMTQNGLKWTLNTTLKDVTFCHQMKLKLIIFHGLFFVMIFLDLKNILLFNQ